MIRKTAICVVALTLSSGCLEFPEWSDGEREGLGEDEGEGGPRSCRDVLAAAPTSVSGIYTIAPEVGGPSFDAYCEMNEDGGGWTRVFVSEEGQMNLEQGEGVAREAYNAVPSDATGGALFTGATDARISWVAWRTGVLVSRAWFPMPEAWVNESPLGQAAEDESVEARVDGGEAQQGVLRFGYANFGEPEGCDADWDLADATSGRVCIQDTAAPLFAAWASGAVDRCGRSNPGHAEELACSPVHRFTIAIR